MSWRRFLTPLRYCLDNLDMVRFKYVSGGSLPDQIVCYDDHGRIYTFYWIEGHDSVPTSRLGRLYAAYVAQTGLST